MRVQRRNTLMHRTAAPGAVVATIGAILLTAAAASAQPPGFTTWRDLAARNQIAAQLGTTNSGLGLEVLVVGSEAGACPLPTDRITAEAETVLRQAGLIVDRPGSGGRGGIIEIRVVSVGIAGAQCGSALSIVLGMNREIALLGTDPPASRVAFLVIDRVLWTVVHPRSNWESVQRRVTALVTVWSEQIVMAR